MIKKDSKKKKLTKKPVIAIIIFVVIFVLSLYFYRPYFFEQNPQNLRFIGLYYLKKKDYQNASEAFAKAYKLKPTNENRYYLGDSLVKNGDYADGIKYLQDARREDPKNVKIYLAIGDYYLAKKMFKEAITYYQKAYDIGPNSYVNFKLGVYYYETKQTSEAYEHLVKSLNSDPDNLEIYPYLAEVYTRKGLFISAFEAYEHYVNEKCKIGIPYAYLLTNEYDRIHEKMNDLRDMAGEM